MAFVTDTGHIYMCGEGFNDHTNTNFSVNIPTQISGFNNVISVSYCFYNR